MAITSRALAFASRWFEPGTVASVFEPLVADWQREWLEAAPSRRRLVHWRGLMAFACAVLISSPQLFRAAPRPLATRVISRTGLFMLIAPVVISVPVLRSLEEPWSLPLLLYLLPSMFTYALPFSTIIGADAIRCHDDLPPHVQRGAALKVATFTLVLMVMLSGWIVPAARANWLRAEPATADALAARKYETPQHAERISRVAAAMAVMPPLLLWIRWRALDMPRRRGRFFSPMPLGLAVTLAIAGYVLLSAAGGLAELWWSFPRGSGALLPVLGFAFTAIPEEWWSKLRRQGAIS
jgi:hypothetical protein